MHAVSSASRIRKALSKAIPRKALNRCRSCAGGCQFGRIGFLFIFLTLKHGVGQTLSDAQRKVLAGGFNGEYSIQSSAMKRKRIKLSPTRATALHSRPPLERMMRMHERLKAGRYPNCRKLADELEVSSKTVQRDIELIRYRLGLPIEYDQLHFGFYYTEPVASFPNVEISEGELVALYVGQKALAQYKGTSFEAPLSTAFRKITDGLRDTISMTWS